MRYEQADYEAEMAAAGQAEYEAQFGDYLDQLINDKQFYLYALEVIADELRSTRFTKSGLTALEYLEKEKTRLLTPKGKPEPKKERVPGICFTCGKPCSNVRWECDECGELPF